MSLVTAEVSVSLDLVAAGRDQSVEHPFGLVVERLHTWMFEHRDDSPDEVAGILFARAYVMGRHMFGPDRGEWDLGWQGRGGSAFWSGEGSANQDHQFGGRGKPLITGCRLLRDGGNFRARR